MRLGVSTLTLCLSLAVADVRLGATPVAPVDPCASMPVAAGAAPVSLPRPTPRRFAVASLNMAGQARIDEPLARWVRDRESDIVLLQEVGSRALDGAAFTASLAGRLGYAYAYAPADRVGDGQTQGLAIVSREPLDDVRIYRLAYHHLRFKSRCRIALAATVSTSAGPVRVMNVHLDTRINSAARVAQLAPLVDALDRTGGPQILGGDFNTMNVGWLHSMWPFPYAQHQAEAVRAQLAASAFQTPFTGGRATFKLLGLPIHLDWLYLKALQAVDWSVDEVRYSDHRGVWARVTE
jgi:endonuclease/exonuclease/phosphatase family metal-dependent hydrolase